MKRKQIRPTASDVQQWRNDNLATKKHRSDVHKAAVHLFDAEKKKPDGISIWQVHNFITSNYETCPGTATISCNINKGLVDVSPMMTGSKGHILAWAYKNLC